jgi:eukaryotic-like serine/threonine-protein kinase
MHLAIMQSGGSNSQSEAAVRDSLARILASPGFANAIRSRRFLEFVVNQTLAGDSDALKEYTLAIEVFGRKDSYDSREHSAVRVEASRVRTRLAQYYETHGRDEALVIELPKGGYVPRFREREFAPQLAEPLPVERDRKNPALSSRFLWLSLIVVVGIAAATWIFPTRHEKPDAFRYQTVTDSPGEETSPSISADGNTFVYARRERRVWHIFRRVRGQNPVDLTADSPVDNTQPSFSPDGKIVAFRSERDGGGIFVMSSNGESVRRISDFGFNPSWSPDGKSIVCATEPVVRPEQRLGFKSALFVIDVASRRTQQIFAGDAVQPSWSPSGKRIAYWTIQTAGQGMSRDIWTISSDGKNPVSVTADRPLDWCPRWSPDGKHLYFLSDRDGSMNLWRVPIDESSGKVLGALEPQTSPSVDMSVFSFARSEPRMVYENRLITGRLIARDLASGKERAIVTMPPSRQPVGPDVSHDGQWITFYSIGKQEDIYVVRPDGSGLRQLTDDLFQDRGPRWSPDGQTIAFTSNRSGSWQIWMIRPDGSQLRQFTKAPAGAEPIQAVWSPDGRFLAYNRTDGDSVIIDLNAGPTAEPQALSARGFQVRTWSPDGRKLVGQIAGAEKSVAKMIEYDLGSGQTRELGAGNSPSWAPDSKHVLFSRNGGVWQIDVASLKEELLASMEPAILVGQRLSPDQKSIYVGATTIQSDLWIRTPAR